MTKRQLSPRKPNPQELARREDIFRVYRDLGPARSYDRLIVAVKDRFGHVYKKQLMAWSKEYSWQERLRVHDLDEEKRRALAERDELDGSWGANFDQQDALLKAAAKALKRALEATVTVALKPSELKALVDTAVNAIKLVEMLRSGDAGKKSDGSGNKRMFQVLDALEARLRAGVPQVNGDASLQVIDVTPEPMAIAGPVEDFVVPEVRESKKNRFGGIEKPDEKAAGMTMAERLAQRAAKN